MVTNTAPSTSGVIDVGTATLYHEVHGRGPALLLIIGGGGDAGLWGPMVPALAEEFMVVTYDRRGFSRSPRPPGWTTTSAAEQADDAAGLLRALDLAPAGVVGVSSGAIIACALVVRYPDLLRHAVIAEPPLLAVVPGGESIAAGLRSQIEQAMAEGGPRHAMEAFARSMVGDEAFEVMDPEVRERMLGNGVVFFTIEMPGLGRFVPDRVGLRASGVPLTVMTGTTGRHAFFDAAAAWLAEGTGADRVALPGGHGGLLSHPEAFAEAVRGSVS